MLTLILASAAFGFLFPHVFVPVHYGLELGAAIGYGVLGAVVAALLALLIAWIVRVAKRFYRADRKKFFWTLKNGVIPYCAICVVCAAAIVVCAALPALFPQPVGSTIAYYCDSYADLLDYLQNDTGLFSKFEHTVHETDEVETTLSEEELEAPLDGSNFPQDFFIGHASYFFADFPSHFAQDYHTTQADGGTYVEVEVLTITLPDGGVVSSPVFNPELQGGIRELVPSGYIGSEFNGSYVLVLDCDIPLYEAAQANNFRITLGAALAASFAGTALLLGIYTAIYLPRRKKFLRAHQAEDAE